MKQKIDAHCHFFNKDIISRRLIIELIAEILELLEIKHNETDKKEETKKKKKLIDKKLIRILDFIYVATRENSTEVYKTLDRRYRWFNRFIYTPLTLDIDFVFHENYDGPVIKTFENKIKNLVELKSELLEHISNNKELFHKTKTVNVEESLDKFIDFVEEIVKINENDSLENGFKKQISQMVILKAKKPKAIFPFFGVDPRREGIMDLVKENVGNGKPFIGIKLYAPCGYSPTDPLLWGDNPTSTTFKGEACLYQYCIDNKIPITDHCSSQGFSTLVDNLEIKGDIYVNGEVIPAPSGKYKFEIELTLKNTSEAIRERAKVLNFPTLWEKVLDKYPSLKLNLAHFGGDTINNKPWRDEIYKLLTKKEDDKLKYPNLYTDISCTADKTILKIMKSIYDDSPKEVQEKFLYGSDYYLDLMKIDFHTYYKQIRKVFNKGSLDKMSIENAHRFVFGKEI